MPDRPDVQLTVCRGCCCGDTGASPRIDHEAQLQRFRSAAARSRGRLRVRTSECLGPCGHATVVVAQAPGVSPEWFGFVTDEGAVEAMLGWLDDGGPGRAPVPDMLALHAIRAPGRAAARA